MEEAEQVAKKAAERSLNLPIGEIFYLIDQGFTAPVNKYHPSQWIECPLAENIMEKYARYRTMVGAEEFQSLATQVCYLRLTQSVCSGCGKENDLKICQKCKLAFYCSYECQLGHWAVHRTWCCRRYRDVRDTGLAGVILHDKRDCGAQ